MNQVTLTLPLDNAEALMRGSDLLVGLAKDARAKEDKMAERFEDLYPPRNYAPVTIVPEGAKTGREYLPDSEFDSDGLPWDERIHSSNRKLTAQGVWQRRRNVSDELYHAVVAELNGGNQEQDGSLVAATEELPKAEPEDYGTSTLPHVVSGDTPPPPPPPPPASDMTFAELIKEITENQINPDTVLKAVQSAGLPNVGELFNRPDLIPQVARELGLEA